MFDQVKKFFECFCDFDKVFYVFDLCFDLIKYLEIIKWDEFKVKYVKVEKIKVDEFLVFEKFKEVLKFEGVREFFLV